MHDCDVAVANLSEEQAIDVFNRPKLPEEIGTFRWKGERDADHWELTIRI
jgi:hypothetical protein